MFKKKSFILIVLFICLLILSGEKISAQDYDWNEVNKTFIEYIESGGYEKAEELLKLLPDHPIEDWMRGSEAIEVYFSGKYPADVIVGSGEVININIIFRLRYLTDGAYSEHLSILLGSLIENYPKNFLLAIEKNINNVKRLDSILGNTGPEFVDKLDLQIIELKKRHKALEEVEGVNKLVKELCLAKIELEICRTEKYISN